MTANGQPDNPRSARYVLKDFVNGKLLYCVAPPDQPQDEYHVFPPRRKVHLETMHLPANVVRASKTLKTTGEDLDRMFFQKRIPGVHIRGKIGIRNDGRYIIEFGV